jgi:pyruvate dehydrogenase (quinone)
MQGPWEANRLDVLVERLSAWGVDRVFGCWGDGIDGTGRLRRAGKPEFVQVQREETAVPR